MTKEEKLDKILQMLDIIAKLDKSYGIDKQNLKKVYEILATIEDTKYFNRAYKAILSNLSIIFENIEELDKKSDKIYAERNEKIDSIGDEKDLSNIEKEFNL